MYFAISTTEVVRKVIFIEASREDLAWSEIDRGEEVWSRSISDPDFDDQIELTEEEFKAKSIPEDMK
ncbi:MAG: hypothetical protein ACXAC5_03335 [Promethearchaeota archaeon]|jgi:hypothetical protein